jgi:DNA-binding transcriptional LysR family regulator
VEEDTPNAEATVRVSITNGLNALFLAPGMREFSEKNPNIHLHTKSIVSLNDVRENQADMMLAFVPPTSRSDLVVERLGSIHFLPLATKTYVATYGLPSQRNLKDHKFLQSHLYVSNPELWGDWNDLVARGRISHYCDDPLVYGIMGKLDLGISLLQSYLLVHREAVLLDLGVLISLPLYGIALRDRLRSRPVRIVFDWLCETFGETSAWFPREFKPEKTPSTCEGLERVFG